MAHHPFPEVEHFLALEDLDQRRMCAPLQRNPGEVHVVDFDIHGEDLAQLYQNLLEQIIRRAVRISPGTYYDKPITPYPNPANNPRDHTKGHSYFRVLWRSSTDTSTRVEFLIRDYDFYLLGFRRSIDDEEWSIWYCFKDDLGWPAFFTEEDVEQIRFDGGHDIHTEVGGAGSIYHIFYTLAYWHPRDGQDTMIHALQQAILFLSEALRFHWVEEEMVYRIQYYAPDADPVDLDITQFGELPMWKRIGNWRNFSRVALQAGLNNGMIRTSQVLGGFQFDLIYRLYSFMDMMNGLRVLKRIERCRDLEPRGDQRRIQYGLHVVDPGFIALNEEYPEEAAGNWWFP